MAEGGTPGNSSDATFDLLCTPCSDENLNSEAVNFCTECQAYFCSPCVKFHNRMPGMKEHNVLDKDNMKRSGIKKPKSNLPTETCKKHEGKVVDMYCKDEDSVGCAVCFALDHRSCTELFFIPEIATDFANTNGYKESHGYTSRVYQNIADLKNGKLETKKRIESETTDALAKIKATRKNINKRLDEIENQAKTDTLNKRKVIVDKLHVDIEACDSALAALDKLQIKVAHSEKVNDSQLFVNVKMAKIVSNSCEQQCDEIRKHGTKVELIKFYEDLRIEKCLSDISTLGTLRTTPDVYTATHYGDYDVTLAGDSQTCRIIGLCQLTDGTWILTDWNNKKIKRMDSSFHVTDSLTFNSSPWGVCCMGNNEIAVTITSEKKVQFISYINGLKPVRSFTVECSCHGIKCIENELFVTHHYDSKLCVYDTSGKLLRTINKDKSGEVIVSRPCHLAYNSETQHIYVADADKGLVVLDRPGNVISTHAEKEIEHVFGVCLDDVGHVFVCGNGSHKILQAGLAGSKLQVLLKQSDGLKSPMSVFFDVKKSLLLVTVEQCNTVKVFKLN